LRRGFACQNGEQSLLSVGPAGLAALAHGLDHQTVAVPVHDRFVARQLKLHGNANRLVAAIAK
jgi:hypothetical protein